jgi:hypothetical protein
MKKKALASFCTILAAALCGCSTIDKTTRVEGWPELKVVEHDLSYKEMYRACRPYIRALDAPLACTVFYLDAGEAHIYVAKGLKFGPVLDHERLHAAGYDHAGSHDMQKILAQWTARKAAEREAASQAALAILGDKLAHSDPDDYAGW